MNTKIRSKVSEEEFMTLCLARVKGLGPATFLKLLRKFKNSEDIISAGFQTLKKYIPAGIARLVKSIDFEEEKRYLNCLHQQNIKFLTIKDKRYPKQLRQIYDPPIILYYQGQMKQDAFKNCFSVVGTRNMSKYGQEITEQLVSGLVRSGFSIVSGMAFGVDKKAHEVALNCGGNTVAVLSSRVDKPTPRSNFQIYERIKKKHVVISETHVGTEFNNGLFPKRNRIIAGLSCGTLVIEAGEKSGALITAKFALDYGREVFAVPSNVFSKNSLGTNALIKNGEAKLVQTINDILEEFGFKVEGKKKKRDYSLSEQKIVDILIKSPANVDEIAYKTDMDVSELLQIVSVMEIDGLLAKNEQGMYFIIK